MNHLIGWRLAGVTSTIILGFVLHYIYEWTGHSKIIGFFAPVNESVWEHLKLGYLSVALFSVVEYFNIREHVNNYFLAKIIGVICLELTIIMIYYGYTLLTGKNIILIDILSYIIGCVICETLIYYINNLKPLSQQINQISFVALIVLGLLFGWATYLPPRYPIFKDQNTNNYGLPKKALFTNNRRQQ